MALMEGFLAGNMAHAQVWGSIVILLLYATVGILASLGSILIIPRMFCGRWEQFFWAGLLLSIAGFYLGFAAHYDVDTHAWTTELVGVSIFAIIAIAGTFSRLSIGAGYLAHGIWDMVHSFAGTSFDNILLSNIPLGYGVFCSVFDFTVAYYILKHARDWQKQGRIDLIYWRR